MPLTHRQSRVDLLAILALTAAVHAAPVQVAVDTNGFGKNESKIYPGGGGKASGLSAAQKTSLIKMLNDMFKDAIGAGMLEFVDAATNANVDRKLFVSGTNAGDRGETSIDKKESIGGPYFPGMTIEFDADGDFAPESFVVFASAEVLLESGGDGFIGPFEVSDNPAAALVPEPGGLLVWLALCLLAPPPGRTFNIEHRTSNIERRNKTDACVRCSMLNVQCSMFNSLRWPCLILPRVRRVR